MSDVSTFLRELEGLVPLSAQPVEASSASASSASASSTLASAPAQKRLKLLLVTTHTNQVNGYSKVAYHLLKELNKQPWLDLVHYGTQRLMNGDLGRTLPSTVRSIDATAQEKEKQIGFAFAELPAMIQAERPDVVLLYNDLSVICTYIESIRKATETRTFKIWAYVDVTYPYPPPPMMDILNRDVERIFCFTKGWKEHLKAQGATRPIDVLPHAVDTTVYHPIPREVARQSLGFPKDFFLFTSLNKNIPRKRLDLLIIAFTQLIVRHPTKPLFLLVVADKGERGGYPLFDIFARELRLHQASADHFGNRLMVTTKDTCFRDEDINLLYNCGDVGVSCAEGEGFGLCTIEQMALGIPQIVPDLLAFSEYCHEDYTLLVKPTFRSYVPQAHEAVTGESHMVDPEDVAKAMETYVFQEELRVLHGKRGKEKVATYTWPLVCAPLIKRLDALREEED
jgi:hypothetical protein